MKEGKIDYIVDRFVDVNGDERDFVIAAVSYIAEENDGNEDLTLFDDYDNVSHPIEKGIKLGYSICQTKRTCKDGSIVSDTFNEKEGIARAVGKARKNALWALTAEYAGDINSDTVRAFLERRVKYYKNNPMTLRDSYVRLKK